MKQKHPPSRQSFLRPSTHHLQTSSSPNPTTKLSLNSLGSHTPRRNTPLPMPRKLLLIITPHMLKRLPNLLLLKPRQLLQLRSPPWTNLQCLSRSQQYRRCQMSRQILLKAILLKGQVAKELGILFNILGNFFNEAASLPSVVYESRSFG